MGIIPYTMYVGLFAIGARNGIFHVLPLLIDSGVIRSFFNDNELFLIASDVFFLTKPYYIIIVTRKKMPKVEKVNEYTRLVGNNARNPGIYITYFSNPR